MPAIDENFLTAQFHFEGYKIRARHDGDKYGGSLIEFMWRGLTCKRLGNYEPKHSKCLISELTFTNKNWICFSIYRTAESSNLSMFFEELAISLTKAILKYENLLIIGGFNIDVKSKSLRYDKLDKFCGLFNLINSVKIWFYKKSSNRLTFNKYTFFPPKKHTWDRFKQLSQTNSNLLQG